MTDKKRKPKKESISLVKREFTALSKVKKDYTKEQQEFILKTIAPSLNENELFLFLYRSQKLGLNPLEGEIFAYTSHETLNGNKVRKMVMIVARDGKRRIAYRTGHLKAIKTEAIYVRKEMQEKKEILRKVKPWEGGTLWGATCTITRDDYSEPVSVTVPLSEYTKQTSIWKFKPETMIKKVAQSQCLSEAFPELAGVYDESERFDDSSADPMPTMPDGNKPAKSAQLETIKALGGLKRITDDKTGDNTLTRQEAAEYIRELSKKKK